MELEMRLALEYENAAIRETNGVDLLALGWGGLGKLVEIESLSLMGIEFEEIVIDATRVEGEETDRGDAA